MAAITQVVNFAGNSTNRRLHRPSIRRSAVLINHSPATAENKPTNHKMESAAMAAAAAKAKKFLEDDEREKFSLDDYFEQAQSLIKSDGGDGPPRWFSPLECGSHIFNNSPLLLYLPDLILLVEKTVRSENCRFPGRPIYLVGESIGGCLALAVAARNPDIDLVLILANPGEHFPMYIKLFVVAYELVLNCKEPESMIYRFYTTREPLKITSSGLERGFQLEELYEGLFKQSTHISVVADILPRETLLWKLQMMNSAASFVNSRIHAVKAQVLILASGRDPLLPNLEEAEKIRAALPKQEIHLLKDTAFLPKCEIRKFDESGHFIFLEDGIDLVAILKGASFYRRAKFHDYISDYLPPTEAEFNKICESYRWISTATGPVMFSTLDDGKIVRSLEGIPTEGPVVLVGYHMLLGLELFPMVMNFLTERDVLLRGLAHPIIFVRMLEEQLDISMFDSFRAMGAVPVSASNFYKLLASGSHVLLYPGGMREACHKKGEEYQLFWPERSEFVRMAARFGAKIIPFGVVGEDDIGELVLDYDDQMKIPYLKDLIKKGSGVGQLRTDAEGEVANQNGYVPGVLPKIPGRFYYYFGKPIDTAGMKEELKKRDKADEVYLEIKSEVEHCISFLKENREKDPFRSLASRTLYRATNGWSAEVPTFEI
ncbi:hypothetical protein KSS87_003634 [Heliosperma pusillum]|nr:hypothetical protein KSS87_003634 [Heliosperma pusillum]